MKMLRNAAAAAQRGYLKACVGAFVAAGAIVPSLGLAQVTPFDPTANNGKKLDEVINNADTTTKQLAGLILAVLGVVGFVLIALSLWQMYKAGKEERESPKGAIVGLIVGGLLAGVTTVMWMIRNQLLGTGT